MDIRKLTISLLANAAAQFLAGAVLLGSLFVRASGAVSPMIWACIGLILLSSLLNVVGIFAAGRCQNRDYEESMKNLENLNTKLREQKHDLMNHFQVIYGLMELEEYGEARAYMRPVFRDIQKLNHALKTEQPAVNALLQAKLEAAESREIDMYLTVGSTLKQIRMQPWDLCRVLANLIDNAMTALSQIEGEKRLLVMINELEDDYIFEISNNGPAIPEEMMPHLFKSGFTTKKEEEHGLGLAIVTRLVKEAGGTVTATSDEDGTLFRVVLPRCVRRDLRAGPETGRQEGRKYRRERKDGSDQSGAERYLKILCLGTECDGCAEKCQPHLPDRRVYRGHR